MRQNEPHVSAPVTPPMRYFASLSMIATTYVMMHALGCAHQSADHASPGPKSTTVEKQLPSGSAQPRRLEQSDKPKAVEKKLKEKKATASTEKAPGKKPEQPDESGSDSLAPPAPLKPATFGGAGG
jgi:hypothetical protein